MVASGDKGFIIQGDDGLPVFFPFGAAVNPCDPDPEMLLTVTGTTGTINWCGETWTLPADSGVEKSVCPQVYEKYSQRTLGSGASSDYTAKHKWLHSVNSSNRLALTRYYVLRNSVGGLWKLIGANNWNNLRVNFGRDVRYFRNFNGSLPRPVVPTATYGTVSNIKEITTLGIATYSNYVLPDSYFGSYTTGGVTYAWAKGIGW